MASKNEKAGRQPVTDCNRLGNAAKMREAIVKCVNLITEFGDAEIVMPPLDVIVDIEAILKSALSSPPRNCDRPECATTIAAQEVWRREDGGKTAYYEWLLATSTKGDDVVCHPYLGKPKKDNAKVGGAK